MDVLCRSSRALPWRRNQVDLIVASSRNRKRARRAQSSRAAPMLLNHPRWSRHRHFKNRPLRTTTVWKRFHYRPHRRTTAVLFFRSILVIMSTNTCWEKKINIQWLRKCTTTLSYISKSWEIAHLNSDVSDFLWFKSLVAFTLFTVTLLRSHSSLLLNFISDMWVPLFNYSMYLYIPLFTRRLLKKVHCILQYSRIGCCTTGFKNIYKFPYLFYSTSTKTR